MVSHRIRAVVNEIEMCAVGVKMNGNNANKFMVAIIKNRDFMKTKFPGNFLFLNKIFISLVIIMFILLIIKNHLVNNFF